MPSSRLASGKKLLQIAVLVAVIAPPFLILAGRHALIWAGMIEYDLDAESIPDDIVAQVGAETGLALPAGSRALRYHYVPPIDPIVFVKFAVPPDAQQALTAQLAALTWPLQSSFPERFANERCAWWPATVAAPLAMAKAFSNDRYIEAYLVQENGLTLYLKYFTI